MKKTILTLALALIGLSGGSQTLIQGYQIHPATNGWQNIPITKSNLNLAINEIDLHMKDYTNMVSTNQFMAATNAIYTNLTAILSNNQAYVLSNMNWIATNNQFKFFYAVNGSALPVASGAGGTTLLTFTNVWSDQYGIYNKGASYFRPTRDAYWLLSWGLTFTQTEPTGANREILKLFRDGSFLWELDRRNGYDTGNFSSRAGATIIALSSNSQYDLRYSIDGGNSMTTTPVGCWFSGKEMSP